MIYHVLNRGNGRQDIFHSDADAAAFLRVLKEAKALIAMRTLAFCLMSNHWHLVLWPHHDGDLSRFMFWLTNTHVRRYRLFSHSVGGGHLYQARFKSFAVQDDEHLLTVLRYVEANPLRAGIAARAADWKWSSPCGTRWTAIRWNCSTRGRLRGRRIGQSEWTRRCPSGR